MDLKLQGHTVVVVGGASGIGMATTKLLLAERANVVIWDIRPDTAEIAQDLGVQAVGNCCGCTCDVAVEESVRQAGEWTQQRYAAVDHVVHCAAVGSGKFGFPFTNLQPQDWLRNLQINIMGMVHVAHVVTPLIRKHQFGGMVFLGSVAGQIGSQTDPPYSAAKAANINFAQCLAKDLAPLGVRVNTVNPGMVQTPLNRSVWQAWNDAQPPDEKKSYEEWAGEKVSRVVPLGRWQTVDDIANMIVFLLSPCAGNVTGQTINVDGGFVMHW